MDWPAFAVLLILVVAGLEFGCVRGITENSHSYATVMLSVLIFLMLGLAFYGVACKGHSREPSGRNLFASDFTGTIAAIFNT